MHSNFLLTPDEVAELTGFKSLGKQVHWLSTKGWRFEVNGCKRPIIARRYAEKMLGCGSPDESGYKPNFAAIRAA